MNGINLIDILPFDPNLIWLGAKLFYLFGLLIYVTFAVVVVRQAKLMVNTLNGALEAPVRLIAWAHLALAIMVFLLALVIL